MASTSAIPTLFSTAAECCCCGACVAGCPKSAISLTEDEAGYRYPVIDEELCIRCGKCKRVCGFQHKLAARSVGPFYAAASEDSRVRESASGGIFGELARAMLARGGVVVGCAYEDDGARLRVRHRIVEKESELAPLLGSKYVQSETLGVFKDVKALLSSGREVLYSGTPCQVAGLKGFLGREYEGLLTVDLVCHGVPNEHMLQDYLATVERASGAHVTDARFRSKRDGWNRSLLLDMALERPDARNESLFVPSGNSSYYDMFLGLVTLRDSCYHCPFAGSLRPADLSIGDYWGVERVSPDLLEERGGPFSLQRGVSCLLVNNSLGAAWLEALGEGIVRRETTFAAIAEGNDQLRHPSDTPPQREEWLGAYETGGWAALERLWRRTWRRRAVRKQAARLVPKGIKSQLKRMLGAL